MEVARLRGFGGFQLEKQTGRKRPLSGRRGTPIKFSIAAYCLWIYGCTMRIGLALAMLALCGCDRREVRTIPLDQTTGFRDGYLVKVSRAGTIEWNGQKLDDDDFASYLRQYAALPKNAGRLWVEIEPDAPSERAALVRQQIISSGLCEQQRCVEGRWGVQRPVVY